MSDSTDPLTQEIPRDTELQRALDSLRRHYQRREPIAVEKILDQNPTLRDDPEAVLDLIYQEMLLREEAGQPPDLTEYQRRFPALAEPLRVQFEVEKALDTESPPDDSSASDTAQSVSEVVSAVVTPPVPHGIVDYEILEVLGRGGMGVVYKARQRTLERVVALKVMKPGPAADAEGQLRFQIEAQAVARLQHPNIVQIFEVGLHDDHPFLALEFVDGGSLAEHLPHSRPTPAQAARLVETLATAIHHAHSHGIVHRDLKPANVLLGVRGQGSGVREEEANVSSSLTPGPWPLTPKITDFGLAKLLRGDQTRLTETGAFLGTPCYAAPEQALGRVHEIGPPTDVYALGAILYELLTGQPPFRGDTILATLDQVRSVEPVPPARVRAGVPRDLEIICLKCLEKEPGRRYGSALHLAEDLRRFQDGEPILARPVGPVERVWKWARRRPALAALSGVSVLAVILTVAGLWAAYVQVRAAAEREAGQRRLAEDHFRQALQAVDHMLREVSEVDLADMPQMGPHRKRLLLQARTLYREFLDRRGDDPTVRLEAGKLSGRLGDVLELLGDNGEADAAYRQAVALLDAEDAALERRRELARVHNNRGVLLKKLGRHEEAAAALDAALRLRGQLVDLFPGVIEYRQELATSLYHRGTVLDRLAGQAAAAGRAYRAALLWQETLVQDEPGRADYQADLARTLNNLGKLLAESDPPGAEKVLRRAFAIHEALCQKNPDDPTLRRQRAHSANNLATRLHARGSRTEAERHYRLALEALTRLSLDYPTVPAYRQDLAALQNNVGTFLEETGQTVEAEALYRAAVTVRQKWADDSPEVPDYRLKLAQIRLSLAAVLELRGRTPEAERTFHQARAGLRELAEKYPNNPEYRNEMGVLLTLHADLYSRRGRWREPFRFGQVLLAGAAGDWGDFVPPLVRSRADVVAARDCLREAVPHQRAALDGRPSHAGYRKALYDSLFALANHLLRLGDHEEAARVAVELPPLYPTKPGEYVCAAELLARAAALAGGDVRFAEDRRRELHEAYAAGCVAQLNRAVDRGFRNAQELLSRPEYEPLRERPDFRRLLDRMRSAAPVIG